MGKVAGTAKKPRTRVELTAGLREIAGAEADIFQVRLIPPTKVHKIIQAMADDAPTNVVYETDAKGITQSLVFERGAIGWSADREGAAVAFADDLAARLGRTVINKLP